MNSNISVSIHNVKKIEVTDVQSSSNMSVSYRQIRLYTEAGIESITVFSEDGNGKLPIVIQDNQKPQYPKEVIRHRIHGLLNA